MQKKYNYVFCTAEFILVIIDVPQYIGSMEVKQSMRSLNFQERTEVAKFVAIFLLFTSVFWSVDVAVLNWTFSFPLELSRMVSISKYRGNAQRWYRTFKAVSTND